MTKRGFSAYEEIEDPAVEDSLSPAHFQTLDEVCKWYSFGKHWDSDTNTQNGYKLTAKNDLFGCVEFQSSSVAGVIEKAIAFLTKDAK